MKRIEIIPVKRCGKCYRLIPERMADCPYCNGTYAPVEVQPEPEVEPEVEYVREPMSEETKKKILYAILGIVLLAAIGIALYFILSSTGKSSKVEKDKDDVELTDESDAEEVEAEEVEAIEAVRAESPFPETPECDVRGNLAGFGTYRLVVNETYGQICPGEYGKEGKLQEIQYNKETGSLTMSAYTMSGTYCGRYEGTLTKSGDHVTYTGSFVNTRGKYSSFTME